MKQFLLLLGIMVVLLVVVAFGLLVMNDSGTYTVIAHRPTGDVVYTGCTQLRFQGSVVWFYDANGYYHRLTCQTTTKSEDK